MAFLQRPWVAKRTCSRLPDKIPSSVCSFCGSQHNFETDAPYIFAAGDSRTGPPRQIVTAVGEGAATVIAVQWILQASGADAPASDRARARKDLSAPQNRLTSRLYEAFARMRNNFEKSKRNEER